ncbi:MAG: hypothetical protein SFY81_07415 [Verrucomicrobiota bacterium]|nr:hypothetical protein [Verrucomicrobiota bacterium]
MKTVLQNTKTGLYLQKLGQWTTSSIRAHAFNDPLSAMVFAEKNDVQNVKPVSRLE